MIGDILQPTHLLFVLVIALIVLGPKRLPEAGRALGKGLRDFKNALNTDDVRDQMITTTNPQGTTPISPEPDGVSEAQVPNPAPTAAFPTADQVFPTPATPGSTTSEPASEPPLPPREPAASGAASDEKQ